MQLGPEVRPCLGAACHTCESRWSTVNRIWNPTVALREEARQAARNRASIFSPISREAILAKGYYHYAVLKDYDTAVHYV